MAKKTWRQKFETKGEPHVGPSVRVAYGEPVGSLMLIPTPKMVDDYIKAIPAGQERTLQQMSSELAAKHGAVVTCPMCCGLFLRICAELANQEGLPTPYWRMMPLGAPIRKKLSFGVAHADAMRAQEGLPIPRN